MGLIGGRARAVGDFDVNQEEGWKAGRKEGRLEGRKESRKHLRLTGLICVKSQASAVSGGLPPPPNFSPPRYVGNTCMGVKLVRLGEEMQWKRVLKRCLDPGSLIRRSINLRSDT
jgi:hypothetical protein